MVQQPERRCVPVEVEPVPLYRESRQAVRRRREERRERRRAGGGWDSRRRAGRVSRG